MQDSTNPRALIPAVIVSIVLTIIVVVSYVAAARRQGTVVLPGGITYLGPTPTIQQKPQQTAGKIPVPGNAQWTEREGTTFPYRMMVPQTLNLGVFPNDLYDAITVFYEGTDSNANIFFRIENLVTLKKKSYQGKLKEYATDWWKDYTWSGVSEVTPFTNSQGLTGYRAKYLDRDGNTPYEHVFFAVPNRNELIIWMSGKLFEQFVFDRIVDSVSWK